MGFIYCVINKLPKFPSVWKYICVLYSWTMLFQNQMNQWFYFKISQYWSYPGKF